MRAKVLPQPVHVPPLRHGIHGGLGARVAVGRAQAGLGRVRRVAGPEAVFSSRTAPSCRATIGEDSASARWGSSVRRSAPPASPRAANALRAAATTVAGSDGPVLEEAAAAAAASAAAA